nr:hypothetical protein [Tanacetum cinerariifolium]
EKVLVITALKEQLNKLKGKALLTEVVSLNPIDPALLQVDVAPLVPKLCKNRTAHTDYIRHTQEEAATLRKIVESERLLGPLNTSLPYALILKLREKLNSLSGDVKIRKVKREVEEIETLNLELDHKVTKLAAKNEHLKQTYKQLYDSFKSSRVQSKEQCDDLINKVNLKSAEVSDLNASLQEKVLVITALKEQLNRLKGKAVLTKAVSLNPIDPALLQVDVAPLVPKLCKNRTAHTDYIRHTQEEAATLREIVESKAVLPKAVSLNPIDPTLLQVDVVPLVPKLRKNRTAHIDYIKHTLEEAATLRELVESERLLSPLNTPLAHALAVTPKNQTKRVRHTLQITKSEKTSVNTSPSPNIDSNTPVLSSTGVALVSNASGSQFKDNTKKNRIRRTLKKTKETELEDYPRNVKSSLNKASVVNSRASSSVIKSVLNVNSNLKCASYNGCLFSDNHDACVVEYINSVNASRKSKSAKKPVNRKVWKTTGKVFKTIGYIWKPTRRTFTLVGNVCPLTRIATATIVPPREPIPIV